MSEQLQPEQLEALERLAALRASGALTEAEFQHQKAALIGTGAFATQVPSYARTSKRKRSASGFVIAFLLALVLGLGGWLIAYRDPADTTKSTDSSAGRVPSQFEESVDEFDGATKAIAYTLLSEREDAKLFFSCEDRAVSVYFSFRSLNGPWPAALPMDVKTKLGDLQASVEPFVAVPGTIGIAPGNNSQTDKVAFLKRLRGHRRMVIQPTLRGFTSADRPSVFNITGIETPIDRVMTACRTAARDAPERPAAPADSADPQIPPPSPPLQPSTGQTSDAPDPARRLRCYVEGQYVGDTSLTECAQLNGVDTTPPDEGG